MGKTRTIKKGEHAPRVAAEEGFGDFTTVWDHPDNAALKQTRNPCVLSPGDELFIPDRLPHTVQVHTGRVHTFIIKRTTIRLRLVLKDASGRPLRNAPCRLRCGPNGYDLTLDSDGRLDQELPIDTESCTLALPDREFTLSVGFLPPIEDVVGQRARLNNLGYDVAAERGDDFEDDSSFRSAVEDFQHDQGLTPNGMCDGMTLAKLQEVHGC